MGKFCEGVADAPEDVVYFSDTSVFDRKTDARLGDALLNRVGNTAIVPPFAESSPPTCKTRPQPPWRML